jgi:hypothetical protein
MYGENIKHDVNAKLDSGLVLRLRVETGKQLGYDLPLFFLHEGRMWDFYNTETEKGKDGNYTAKANCWRRA